MKLIEYAVVTELTKEQQERFIKKLEDFKDDKDIVYGIEMSLAVLGYKVLK